MVPNQPRLGARLSNDHGAQQHAGKRDDGSDPHEQHPPPGLDLERPHFLTQLERHVADPPLELGVQSHHSLFEPRIMNTEAGVAVRSLLEHSGFVLFEPIYEFCGHVFPKCLVKLTHDILIGATGFVFLAVVWESVQLGAFGRGVGCRVSGVRFQVTGLTGQVSCESWTTGSST